MHRQHLFVVGFMAAGKSTVGRLVAAQAGRSFIDLDERIAEHTGRSIHEIFETDGEACFRALEVDALTEIATRPAAIVATGGGLMLAAANRQLMRRSGFSVWLDLTLAEAALRVAAAPGRPLWNDQDSLKFRSFFEKRRVCYALADGRIDVSRRSIEQVVADVSRCFEGFFD